MPKIRATTAFLLLSIAQPAAAQTAQMSDSSGVTIVRNGNPWTAPIALLVDTQPRLQLGAANRDSLYQFPYTVSAIGTAAGGVAVALWDDALVRVFDSSGKFVRNITGSTEIVSRFRRVTSVKRGGGDTILAYDDVRGRVTRVTAAGEVLSAAQQPKPEGCCFPDGSYLALAARRGTMSGDPLRTTVAIVAARGIDGAVADTIAIVQGSDPSRLVAIGETPRDRSIVAPVTSVDAPFGRVLSAAIFGGGFATGDGATNEVRVYGRSRRVLRILRWTAVAEAITPQIIRDFRIQTLASLPGHQRGSVTAALRSYPYPFNAPAYHHLEVDEGGRLWVQKYPLPADTATTWAVFSEHGELLGRAVTPKDETVTWIGENELITVSRPQIDFSIVKVYRIR